MLLPITVIFVLLFILLERRAIRTSAPSVRWAAIALLLLSFAIWLINDWTNNALLPFQWMIQWLDPFVPPGI